MSDLNELLSAYRFAKAIAVAVMDMRTFARATRCGATYTVMQPQKSLPATLPNGQRGHRSS